MKKNIIKTALKCHWKYSFFACIFLFTVGIHAQTTTKTFTKELNVTNYTTMISKGPYSMGFKMNGRIDLNIGGGKFSITPGSNDGIAALTIEEYQIFTWNESKVRQTVEISITADEDVPQDAQKLMDNLKINLELDANNKLRIDDNMNIASFGFSNGWFTSNESFIVLDDGKKYVIKSINIKSSLHIPKKSNLELTSKYIPIIIGDIEGQVHLNVNNTTLKMGNIEQLEASILSSRAEFQSITNAKINGVSSEIKTGCIANLLIGSDYFLSENISNDDLIAGGKQHSYATNYRIEEVEEITISKTTFDKFIIGKVANLTSLESTFSDYTINKLTTKLLLSAKNGDLRIESITESFETIALDNDISSIYLGMNTSPHYTLKLFPNKYTEYDLPSGLISLPETGLWEKAYIKGDKKQAGTIVIQCHDCKVTVKD